VRKISASKSTLNMSEVSQLLNEKYNIECGKITLFRILREAGILNYRNLPYQKFVNEGCFIVIRSTRNGFDNMTTLVLPKGLELILDLLLKRRPVKK